jgi:acetylornithine deacetylase/succinyl-diaminopimelate desuccinylase-like protein
VQFGAALVNEVHPPEEPRSSMNIGLISGGTSINTVAAEANCAIDLRSIDAKTLQTMEAQVRDIVARYDSGDITVGVAVIGDRPAASLSYDHPLVRSAVEVLDFVGAPPAVIEPASTDANIPLALSIPSVCICITSGADAHTNREYIDVEPVVQGMQQLLLLTMSAVEHAGEWSSWNA